MRNLRQVTVRHAPGRGVLAVNTIEKTFRILEEIVAHQEKGLAFSEIVSRTTFPKASTHRILRCLERIGYLKYDSGTGRYYGDLRLSFLGSQVTSHFDLKSYVRPHLLELQALTKHTCHLGIRNGDVGVYLDKIESPRAFGIKLHSAVGGTFPLHCTGMGKVLLAFMDPGERKTLMSGALESFTPNTITQAGGLERELEKVRRRGFAIDHEEITRGIMCVAAPVADGEGRVLAAISVTFPAYIDKDRGIAAEVAAVTRCASAITHQLTGRGGRTTPAGAKAGRSRLRLSRSRPSNTRG
jgi:DNA-binding IclR family transcriptional regulator